MSQSPLLLQGDCKEVLKTLAPDSIEAAVSDPPYGLGDMSPARVAECLAAWTRGEEYQPTGAGFMGKAWDAWTPGPEIWRELYRVLKPGAHALIFAGSRTQDLMSLALRLAGFEIRDTLQWLYGPGFPKSLNIGKNMDWVQAPRDLSKVYVVTKWIREARDAAGIKNKDIDAATNTQMAGHWTTSKSQPAIPALHQVSALLNVLKLTPEQVPAHIVDVLLGEREKAKVERVSLREVLDTVKVKAITTFWDGEKTKATHTIYGAPVRTDAQKWEGWGTALKPAYEPIILARKPLKGTLVQNTREHGCGGINVDGCRVAWSEGEEAYTHPPSDTPRVAMGPLKAGDTRTGDPNGRWPANVILDEGAAEVLDAQAPGASRFFYTAKASRAEREAGLDGHGTRANTHPTVKPIELMRYLVRLITPPGASVIDPFMGSGSTGCAAVMEGARFVGIEREAEYMNIARARIAHYTHAPPSPAPPSPAPPSPADKQLSLFDTDTDTGTQEP